MCRPAQCPNCSKFAWIGCGLHIPRAMTETPKENWCSCEHPVDSVNPKEYPPKAGTGIPLKL